MSKIPFKSDEQRLVFQQEQIDTERAFGATKHVILSTYRKLDRYFPQKNKGGALKLIGVAIAHAYKMGMRAGSKKRWLVEISIDSKPKLSAAVYINAVNVVKTSHDLVEADGIPIELPGQIVSVREH